MDSVQFLFDLEEPSVDFSEIGHYLHSLSSAPASILVQSFWGTNQRNLIESCLSDLSSHFSNHDNLIHIGATTSGEIFRGQMKAHSLVVSITCFQKTSLLASLATISDERLMEYEVGCRIADDVLISETQAVIVFMGGLSLNGEAFVSGLNSKVGSEVCVAGGMAGDNTLFQQTWVLLNDQVIEKGAVAVSLNGHALQAINDFNFSWTPIGPQMTVTKSDGLNVYEIDHRTVPQIYESMLGKSVVASMPDSTLEFPLIVEDQGMFVARSMVGRTKDGAILFNGSLEEGESVRFGVANIRQLNDTRERLIESFSEFHPQACFIYSCTARKSLLGGELEYEFLPLETLAPVSGFFTYGEFYRSGHDSKAVSRLLNVTTTFLALKESDHAASESVRTFHPKEGSEGLPESSLKYQSALIHLGKHTSSLLEQKLLESAQVTKTLEQYQYAVNEVFIVSRADKQGRILDVNENFERISGYTRQELIGKNHNIIRHPDMPKQVFKDLWGTIQSGSLWKGVIKNRAKDGSTYVVRTSIIPIKDIHGEIVEYLSLREDITRQETQRELLVQEQSKAKSILDSQKSLVIMGDLEKSTIEAVNQAFLEFFNAPDLESFLRDHQTVGEFFEAGEGLVQNDMEGQPWYRYLLNHPHHNANVKMTNAQGITRIFSIQVTSNERDSNKVIANFNDITELENERVRAIRAEAAQSMFLANMSHELRTPINGILGFAALMKDTDLNAQQRQYTDILIKSSESLLSLVNDILDLSKITNEEMDLEKRPQQSFRDLSLVFKTFEPIAQEKTLNYSYAIDSNVPECLVYDSLRLHQVLKNLISNAIKFTPKGEKVTVSVSSQPIKANQALVSFIIQDTGIGIPEEKQKLVFEAFKQADSSTTREFGGTGLGLSIANNLVLRMGGLGIALVSEETKGASFSFQLPMQVCRPETSLKDALRHLRIGLMSDSDEVLFKMQEGLSNLGIRFEKQGEDACVKECHQNQCVFDFLIIENPQVFDRIRHTFDEHTQYLFLSELPSDLLGKENVHRIHDYKHDFSELYNVFLAHVLYDSSQLVPQGVSRFQGRILLADDNEINRTLMAEILHKLSIEADYVVDGKQALSYFQSNTYALVLMDINMPVMGGVEATQKIRSYEADTGMAPVPIIALTANVLSDQVKTYAQNGFSGYLSKPVDFDKLIQTLNQFLQLDESTEVGLDTLPERKRTSSLSIQKIAEELTLSEDIVIMLLRQFVQVYQGKISRLDKAVHGGDWDEVYQMSHYLLGAASNLRLNEISDVLKSLERSANEVSEQYRLVPLLGRLKEEFDHFYDQFSEHI